MRHDNSVFHQLLKHVPWVAFDRLVDEHKADRRVRRLTCKDQFLALLFAQLSGSTSLREIEAGLRSHAARLYHLGGRSVARTTLADANKNRPAGLFADLFAHMATASMVGCSFCLDLGYFEAKNANLDMEKARQVPRWREATIFTQLERDVMEYAEAMSQTPPAVTDELSGRLLDQLGAPGLLELTAFIGAANLVSRSNVALGIKSGGLAESCGLPAIADRPPLVASVS